MELKGLLSLLEERLVQHDNNRKEIQNQLQELTSEIIKEADSFEEKISGELQKAFDEVEERILKLIGQLNGSKEKLRIKCLIKQAQEELSNKRTFELQHFEKASSFTDSYKFKFYSTRNDFTIHDENDIETIINKLQDHLNRIHESLTAVRDELTEICTNRRNEAEEVEKRINKDFESLFSKEDRRIQDAVCFINERIDNENPDVQKASIAIAKMALIKKQEYTLSKSLKELSKCFVSVKEEISLKWLDFEERKPTNITPSFTDKGELSLTFTIFSNSEIDALKQINISFKCVLSVWEKDCNENTAEAFSGKYVIGESLRLLCSFKPDTTYFMKMRLEYPNNESCTQWSDGTTVFTTPEFKTLCNWKESPNYVYFHYLKYSVDELNHRIATKIGGSDYYCTIIGNTPLPPNKVTSWSIKILSSEENNGSCILIGVAPSDIDQNKRDNYNKCGWYLHCLDSDLTSGPPHNYDGNEYGPRKEKGEYVHTGDIVGVIMDTTKGELSFVLGGINLGVAYEGVPLDKPLVLCVLLKMKGDSVELDISEAKENEVDSSIPVPCNITTKSETWDSITLTWDDADGALFYQIEVDGTNHGDASTTNTFTKRELFSGTEYNFRLRTVKDNKASEWSDAVKEKTTKKPFEASEWKKCPGYVSNPKKYSLGNDNLRIATKNGDQCCTIIGDVFIPINRVTSWSIKILKSKYDGGGISIGIAPFNIDQNEDNNYKKCGWYFDCFTSTLWSGPPHNYNGKEHGLKKKEGNHVRTRDSVGVVIDTMKGNLSFIVNGINYGVAYERIPLDKPLVPCVLLYWKGDYVELDLSEARESVDNSFIISKIIARKGDTWDSINLIWDIVEGASFYQIEVNGDKKWEISTKNTFVKKELLGETEHSFRVRAVRRIFVSEWSDAVKRRTGKAPSFLECVWKDCCGDPDEVKMCSINKKNPRIASMIKEGFYTIVGNNPLPPNKVTSWNIKVLKSKNNDGHEIFIGVAPFGTNHNDILRGWYYYCFDSNLYSISHKYWNKEYGPRKNGGEYVHTGDSVGVVMDITKGELSFVVNGVNLGVAYEGIPLDKSLVPCVILNYKGDSVELLI